MRNAAGSGQKETDAGARAVGPAQQPTPLPLNLSSCPAKGIFAHAGTPNGHGWQHGDRGKTATLLFLIIYYPAELSKGCVSGQIFAALSAASSINMPTLSPRLGRFIGAT